MNDGVERTAVAFAQPLRPLDKQLESLDDEFRRELHTYGRILRGVMEDRSERQQHSVLKTLGERYRAVAAERTVLVDRLIDYLLEQYARGGPEALVWRTAGGYYRTSDHIWPSFERRSAGIRQRVVEWTRRPEFVDKLKLLQERLGQEAGVQAKGVFDAHR